MIIFSSADLPSTSFRLKQKKKKSVQYSYGSEIWHYLCFFLLLLLLYFVLFRSDLEKKVLCSVYMGGEDNTSEE